MLDKINTNSAHLAITQGLLILCFLFPVIAFGQNQDRPNILFILADDVGQEVLGCYGGESYSTPHLDELARTGMQFNHVYSMPNCVPSRITLMTGRYPLRFGTLVWGSFPESHESHTFSNLLRNNGYQTGIAGKWQLTLLREDPDHPDRLGFNHSDLFGWHEGPRYYQPMIYRNGKVREDTEGHYGPDLYLRSIIEFMKSNRGRPFMAYYSMALCHDVTDDLAAPVPHGPLDRYDSYAEMVAEMDRNVGRLMAALNDLGLRERTLILFVADNGTPQQMIVRAEGNNLIKEPVISRQNGRMIPGGKATLKDGGTRVPMIANWPGTIEPGLVVEDLVDFTDFLPTFLELGGIPLPEKLQLDGRSFASVLLGRDGVKRNWVFAEEFALPKPGGVEPSREITGLKWLRNAHWKLYNDNRLYNMMEDPLEENPVHKEADSEEGRQARSYFEKIFDRHF